MKLKRNGISLIRSRSILFRGKALINTKEIIDEVVEAHGGIGRWKSLVAVEAVISASGFLFTAKRRPAQSSVRVRAYAQEPRFLAFDFPKRGQSSELIGDNEVRILDSGGDVIASRANPIAAFKSLRRGLYRVCICARDIKISTVLKFRR